MGFMLLRERHMGGTDFDVLTSYDTAHDKLAQGLLIDQHNTAVMFSVSAATSCESQPL
jgi:hypothetical protein